MRIGIIGFPQAGKRTLIAALQSREKVLPEKKRSNQQIVVNVPDERLNKLSAIFKPRKQVNATVEYWLLPDVETGASGKQSNATWLSELKKVDAILMIVRAFHSDIIPHPMGKVDPLADAQWLSEELLLNDLSVVETRLERLGRQIAKTNAAVDVKEQAILNRCRQVLEQGQPLRRVEFNAEEERVLRGFQFLSAKPLIFGVNVAEEQLNELATVEAAFAPLIGPKTVIVPFSAQIEKEIAALDSSEQPEFLAPLGLTAPLVERLLRSSYALLQQISFFTVGEDECRAWTIKQGTPAVNAARAIHSDIERGFIRAEVVSWSDLVAQGNLTTCRKLGLLRSEGKQYIVRDGDVIEFLFNV